jgi:uncharacterized protein (DUF58 family)
MAFRLFERRENRAVTLRQQAGDLFARLKDAHVSRSKPGLPLRGQHNERKGGAGHDFWQYRDFQNGDHARAIDWKQSAKSDRLLIRQKEKEIQRRTSIWLQNDSSMAFGAPEKYECGSVIALVAAMLCENRHDPVSLCGVGYISLDTMTDILANKQYRPDVSGMSAEEIFLIGDFLSPSHEIFNGIPDNKTVHLIQILDPAELDLPFDGRVIFELPAGSGSEHILNVDSIRTEYKARLQFHNDQIRADCLSRDWSYTFVRNGQDLLEPLLDIIMHEEALP